MRSVLIVLMLSVLLGGCQKMKSAKSMESEPRSPRMVTLVDDTMAWEACMLRCEQDDELGKRTRKGCLWGCGMSREALPFADKEFDDAQVCISNIDAVDAAAQIDAMIAQCKAQSKHLYKRRGCYDAARAYYAQLSGKLCVEMTEEELVSWQALRELESTIPAETKK